MDAPPIQYLATGNGINIAYCISGSGTPLVLMPDFYSHLYLQWRTVLHRSLFEPLAERFKLVQYDLRGQGISSRGLPKAPTTPQHVHDVHRLSLHLKLQNFLLYANTVSAPIAVAYAAVHPERVCGLVLERTALEWPVQLLTLMKIAEESHEMYLNALAGLALRYEDRDSAVGRMRASMNYDEVLRSHSRPDPFKATVPLLPQITVPTLLVVPAEPRGMPFLENAREMAAMIPDAAVVFAKGENYTTDGSLPELVSILEEFQKKLLMRLAAPSSEGTRLLSVREIEVLRLLSAGKTNQQIASQLVISPNTVGRHVANILGKTGAANRAEAASYAHRNLLL